MAEEHSVDIDLDQAQLVLIVAGAHLRAEVADRPLAYQVQHHIRQWLSEHSDLLSVHIEPIVCSDIWYVNQEDLQRMPTISIGGPGVNALSAFLGQKLPTALVRDEKLVVQLDADFVDLRACVWGMDHALTVEAVTLFSEQYLDGFLRAVATQVEPHG